MDLWSHKVAFYSKWPEVARSGALIKSAVLFARIRYLFKKMTSVCVLLNKHPEKVFPWSYKQGNLIKNALIITTPPVSYTHLTLPTILLV